MSDDSNASLIRTLPMVQSRTDNPMPHDPPSYAELLSQTQTEIKHPPPDQARPLDVEIPPPPNMNMNMGMPMPSQRQMPMQMQPPPPPAPQYSPRIQDYAGPMRQPAYDYNMIQQQQAPPMEYYTSDIDQAWYVRYRNPLLTAMVVIVVCAWVLPRFRESLPNLFGRDGMPSAPAIALLGSVGAGIFYVSDRVTSR